PLDTATDRCSARALIRDRKTRSFICVLLAVLLVAIQQGGFAHALSHFANPVSQNSSRSDTQHPAEKVCIECIVFAHLDTALSATPTQIAIPPAIIEVAVAPFRAHDPEFVP